MGKDLSNSDAQQHVLSRHCDRGARPVGWSGQSIEAPLAVHDYDVDLLRLRDADALDHAPFPGGAQARPRLSESNSFRPYGISASTDRARFLPGLFMAEVGRL